MSPMKQEANRINSDLFLNPSDVVIGTVLSQIFSVDSNMYLVK